MLAPKRDEFLVVAVLGSAVVDHFMCATRLQRTPCAPGLAAAHPKLFSAPRLFTHPSHP